MKQYPSWVGGQTLSPKAFEVIRSPYDQQPVGEVGVGTSNELELGMAAAAAAFPHTRALPTHERVRILMDLSRTIASHTEGLARLITLESGKPIRYSRAEVARAVITFELGAAEARRLGGEVMPIDLEARAEGRLCLYTRVPAGPIAAISPFNFPLNLVAHKLSPAVAIGAPTLLKPPPQCPLTAHELSRLFHTCGVPDGFFNVVHCSPEIAQQMVEDERFKVLSFTGSDTVGWKLKALAKKKKVLLELGGNAPCVIDETVPLNRVMDDVVSAAWANAGQVCIKAQKIFVHEKLYDEFLARFLDATRRIACGNPLREETVVGPLIERQHVERVLTWVREATAAGAILQLGGDADGQVVQPTVLTGTTRDMRVSKDEVFGPVTVIEPFSKFSEALSCCNETRFGLQAGVFTQDIGRALQAFRELDYGGVLINDTPMFRVDNYPYGGTKDSGFGREGVRFAIEEMTEMKALIARGLN